MQSLFQTLFQLWGDILDPDGIDRCLGGFRLAANPVHEQCHQQPHRPLPRTPSNKLIWNGIAPLKFTEKVTTARSLTTILVKLAGRQTATTVGHAQDKGREEKELEDEVHKLGRALVNSCKDTDDPATAAKYDFQISSWRRLRDEVLLNKARLLATDAALFTTGSTATAAAGYGITPAA